MATKRKKTTKIRRFPEKAEASAVNNAEAEAAREKNFRKN